jgi:hypothetical protein
VHPDDEGSRLHESVETSCAFQLLSSSVTHPCLFVVLRALLRAGRYKDVRAVLQVYDAAGFVRLNILHEALGAVGLGPIDEQGVGRGGAGVGSGSRGAAAGDARQ